MTTDLEKLERPSVKSFLPAFKLVLEGFYREFVLRSTGDFPFGLTALSVPATNWRFLWKVG
jgi:hypothetical protein